MLPLAASTTYRSTNNGSSWTTVTGLNVQDANPVADPINTAKFYAYNPINGSMLVSTNGGMSFTAAGSTGSNGSVLIRTVPGKEGDIWVPLYNGGLSRSTNSGQSFSNIGGVTYCGAVGFGKAASGSTFPTVYIWGTVNNVRGIYRSIDQGATWTRVNDDAHEYGGPANGKFVQGDMNVFGRVYMSTAGRGIAYGEIDIAANNLSVTPLSLSYAQGGGTQTVTVTSNVTWTVTTNASWITASPSAGTNNGSFAVTCSANGGIPRTGTVTVTGGGVTKTINVSQAGTGNAIIVRARGTKGTEVIELRSNNVTVGSWRVTTTYANYSAVTNGALTVHYTNDAGNKTDAQIDYVSVNGTIYQAEAQSVNTGYLARGTCGGRAFSEWLNCNGYIAFTTASARSATAISYETENGTNLVSAYPNPVEGRVTITMNAISPETTISLIERSGKVVHQVQPVTTEHVVDMTSMPSGLYLIRVADLKTHSTIKVFKK